jgi:hypothetical protein
MEENMIEQDNQISEFDLTRVFRTLWKRKELILSGTAVVTVLAAIISLVLPKVYRSGGFFQLSGSFQRISVPEYKKNVSLFTTPVRFIGFVQEKKYFQKNETSRLMRRYGDPENLSKSISPIFSYSKEDVRETGQGSPEVNYVLGTSIYAESNSAANARQTVYALGTFLRDCILYGKLGNFINNKCNNSRSTLRRIENQIIDTNFSLEIQQKKKEELNVILKRYPDAGKFGAREIVPPGNDGYRYLAPVTQLVGVESTIADLKGTLISYRWEKEKVSLDFEISTKAQAIMNRNQSGEKALQEILEFADGFFKTQDLTRTSIQEVVNQFYNEMDVFRTLFYEDMRFLSGPPFPAKVVRPWKRLIVMIAFSFAFFFFLFIAFAVEWWQKNKKQITARTEPGDNRP